MTRVYCVSCGSSRQYFANKNECFLRALRLVSETEPDGVIEVTVETFGWHDLRVGTAAWLNDKRSEQESGPRLQKVKVLHRALGLRGVNDDPSEAQPLSIFRMKDFR
jgi:hypothetical protein